jgi:hypothetical protein
MCRCRRHQVLVQSRTRLTSRSVVALDKAPTGVQVGGGEGCRVMSLETVGPGCSDASELSVPGNILPVKVTPGSGN